jgi:hypothetical protein
MSGNKGVDIKSLSNLGIDLKLVLKLIGDKRVSWILKLLPIASFLYMILPDLMPGPLDDIAMIGVLNLIFIQLSPEKVVKETLERLQISNQDQ